MGRRCYPLQVLCLMTVLLPALFTDVTAAETERTYTIALESHYAPYEYRNAQGELVGFEVELLNAIAQEQGLKLKLEEYIFDKATSLVVSGELDGVGGGCVLTGDRKRTFSVTDPYMKAGLGLMYNRSLLGRELSGPEQLTGRKVCVETGSLGHRYVRSRNNLEMVTFYRIDDALEAFNQGHCHAMVCDYHLLDYYIRSGTVPKGQLLSERLTNVDYGFLINKQRTELTEQLNAGLKELRESGELDRLKRKWFAHTEQE